jgi:hypothetical protein
MSTHPSSLESVLDRLVPMTDVDGDWSRIVRAAGRRTRRRRRGTALGVAAAALVVGVSPVGGAIADRVTEFSAWVRGEPAPQSVVSDFGSYAPQLGFNPEPGRAVKVAADGDTILYATTNTQGSYCLIASTPWKRPATLPDGGTCVTPARASAPLIAGLVGAKGSADGEQMYVIAGRTTDPEARTIRFSDPSGASVTRPIGSSGFFIATIRTDTPACASGDWAPTFDLLDINAAQRSTATITLGTAPAGSPGVCIFAAPHA